jgi:hypothetical protein
MKNFVTKKQAQDLIDIIIEKSVESKLAVSNFLKTKDIEPGFCSRLKKVVNGTHNMRDNSYNVAKTKMFGKINSEKDLFNNQKTETKKSEKRDPVILLLTFEVEISNYPDVVELLGEPVERRFKD